MLLIIYFLPDITREQNKNLFSRCTIFFCSFIFFRVLFKMIYSLDTHTKPRGEYSLWVVDRWGCCKNVILKIPNTVWQEKKEK